MSEPALMAVVRAVAEGAAPPEELVEALEATRRELDGQRHGFEAALARETPAVQQLVTPEVAAVNQSLDDYVAVLESCGAYLQGFDAAYLDSALQNLPRAAVRLNLDFFRFREAVLSQRGPTTHPGLNNLLAVADTGGDLEAALELEAARLQAPISEHHALSELLTAWQRDYAQALGAPVSDEWFANLEELGRRYARIDTDAVSRRYAEHPTPIPTLNLALNSAWLLTQDSVEPELVLYFLDELQRSLATQEAPPQALVDWAEQLGAWLEAPSEAGLQPLIEEAQAAAERYRKDASKPAD